MDINQVRFGNYTIGNSQANLGKKEETKKGDVEQKAQNNDLPKISADDFYNAMNIAGLQNKAQISIVKKDLSTQEGINALIAKYSTPEQVKNIEAMMNRFNSGVEKTADVIDAEFKGIFKPADKYALAAKVFAQNE